MRCSLKVDQKHRDFKTVWEDFGIFDSKLFCGYKSLEQALTWLDMEDLHDLFSKGYRIYKITVNNVLIGEHQVAFRKENIVTQEDITNLIIN